jgi:hypothetical protein
MGVAPCWLYRADQESAWSWRCCAPRADGSDMCSMLPCFHPGWPGDLTPQVCPPATLCRCMTNASWLTCHAALCCQHLLLVWRLMACHMGTQGDCCTASAHTSRPQQVSANLTAAHRHTGTGSATPPKTATSAPSAEIAWARSTAAARPSCTLAATPTQPPSIAWPRGRATRTRSTSGGGWHLAESHGWHQRQAVSGPQPLPARTTHPACRARSPLEAWLRLRPHALAAS